MNKDSHTHIGCFSECLEFLLLEWESAEGQRRVFVVFQLWLDLLNLLITLGGVETEERGVSGGHKTCCKKGRRGEMRGTEVVPRSSEISIMWTEIEVKEKDGHRHLFLQCIFLLCYVKAIQGSWVRGSVMHRNHMALTKHQQIRLFPSNFCSVFCCTGWKLVNEEREPFSGFYYI